MTSQRFSPDAQSRFPGVSRQRAFAAARLAFMVELAPGRNTSGEFSGSVGETNEVLGTRGLAILTILPGGNPQDRPAVW
jgi:hypothetical protein